MESNVIDLNEIHEPGYYCFNIENNSPKPLTFRSHIQWISVEEQLPTAPQACWVRSKEGVIPAIALYIPKDKCWEFFPPYIQLTINYVTHWAPVEVNMLV